MEVDQLKADLSSIGIPSLEGIYCDVFAGHSAGTQILENLKSNSINSGVLEGISTQKSFEKLKLGGFKIFSIKEDVSLSKELLLGPVQGKKSTHIMVTVGHEMRETGTLIIDLLKAGTTIIRIN